MSMSTHEVKSSLEPFAESGFDFNFCPAHLGALFRAKQSTSSHLDLSNQHLDDDDMQYIVSFLNANPQITSLDLSSNSFGVYSNTSAYFLRHNSTLRELDMSNNPYFSNASVQQLAQHGSLQCLKMNGNGIDFNGIIALAQNRLLTHVELGNNKIDDAGVAALVKKTNLKHLNLENNPITDIGVAIFLEYKELETLNLNGSSISIRGLRLLMEHHKLKHLSIQKIAYCSEMAALIQKHPDTFSILHSMPPSIWEQGTDLLKQEELQPNKKVCVQKKPFDYTPLMTETTDEIERKVACEEGAYSLYMPQYASIDSANTDLTDTGEMIDLGSLEKAMLEQLAFVTSKEQDCQIGEDEVEDDLVRALQLSLHF